MSLSNGHQAGGQEMALRGRLERLERAALGVNTEPPTVLTEADIDGLGYDDLMRILRGQLEVCLVSDDTGPTFDEALAAAGVVTADKGGGSVPERAKKISDAELAVYDEWSRGNIDRFLARRAARFAARGTAGDDPLAASMARRLWHKATVGGRVLPAEFHR